MYNDFTSVTISVLSGFMCIILSKCLGLFQWHRNNCAVDPEGYWQN